MKNTVMISTLVGAALIGTGCADRETTELPMDAAPSFGKVMGPAHVEGVIGSGANYELDLPAEWNGKLVLFAHGLVPASAPVLEQPHPFPAAIRGQLLDGGYGFGWTSYSSNGFEVKDGATRVHQLRGLWNSNFGKPDGTYLMGISMGGGIVLLLTEKHPGIYDGALPFCGIIGGSELAVRYLFDMRVLFDHFFPGVLPGSAINVAVGINPADHVPAIIGAILSDPAAAVELASVVQVDIQYNDFGELISSIVIPIATHMVVFHDLLDRTHGHLPIGNANTVYAGSSDDAALNAGIERFAATPDAQNYLDHWYGPSGKLKIPMLTIHTIRDPLVPFFHETRYGAIASAAGNSDMLVQRAVDRFGHCTFTASEIVENFEDLVLWAETGVKPTP